MRQEEVRLQAKARIAVAVWSSKHMQWLHLSQHVELFMSLYYWSTAGIERKSDVRWNLGHCWRA